MPFIYQFGSLDAVLDRSKCKSNNDRQKIPTKLVVEIIRSISWIIKNIFCNFNCKFRKMSLFKKYDKVNNLKSLKICTNYILSRTFCYFLDRNQQILAHSHTHTYIFNIQEEKKNQREKGG